MFSRQLVDAVTDVMPSRRGKDGRGRPRPGSLAREEVGTRGKKEREKERGEERRRRPLDLGVD